MASDPAIVSGSRTNAPHEASAAASRPLSDVLLLGALPTATPCARLHARSVVCEWGLSAMADTVELLVSELVTNAVQASTSPEGRPRYEDGAAGLPVVYLRLSTDCVRLLVEVWDQGVGAPTLKQAEADEE